MENWVEATIALRAQISTARTVLVLWIIVAVDYQVQMKVSPLKSFGLIVLPISLQVNSAVALKPTSD